MTESPLRIPGGLARLVGDADVDLAYSYEDWSATWRLVATETRFLKLRRVGYVIPLAAERDRLRWARDRVRVPDVVDHGVDGDVEWLLLRGLPGRDATHPGLKARPEWLVSVFARGLRDFHETSPDGCPFDFRIEAALEHVRRRVATDDIDPDGFHDVHRHLTPSQALARLEATRPADEDVVLCHGDYCFPNVLIEGDRVTAYLDLGELGLADRWWDVAVGSWTCTWNLGPGYEDLFFASYGIEADPDRIAFYRLLYDLAS